MLNNLPTINNLSSMKGFQAVRNLRFSINLNLINGLLFMIILILGVFFVTTINDLAIKGYAMQTLQKNVKELAQEKKNMEIKIAYLQSYTYLNEKIIKSGYILSKDVEYIKGVPVNVVARR
ncbi:MAG: hypothetical protein NT091_05095 [Candidatus Falkowbacteria bacterium]|nr:hypothetical protein [Candidatus Falkowbacteria bacterium]